MDLALRRRFFAEEIEAVARLRSRALVDALASVQRERFLPPGPWTVMAEADFTGMSPAKTRQTPDADPARVYHNIGVAIDPERQLFNGQPATLAPWIDALELAPGARVLHIGCGLGYYTAVMAACVGDRGRVLAFEADAALADTARGNLASMPWVEVRADAAAQPSGETFDAILVNAGVTGFVAIYSAIGLRDETLNAFVSKLLMTGPQQWTAITRVRRDTHEPALTCRLHGASFCLSQ